NSPGLVAGSIDSRDRVAPLVVPVEYECTDRKVLPEMDPGDFAEVRERCRTAEGPSQIEERFKSKILAVVVSTFHRLADRHRHNGRGQLSRPLGCRGRRIRVKRKECVDDLRI